MTQKDYLKFDPALIEKHKALQTGENYLSHSTIRFWLNFQKEDYAEHWHLDLEMIMPLENNYTVKVAENTYVLQPGDILIIPPGVSHELISSGDGLRMIYIMEFSVFSKVQGYSLLSTYLAQPVVINLKNCPEIYPEEVKLLFALEEDFVSQDSLREFSMYQKIIQFFSLYAHFRMQQDHQSESKNLGSEKQSSQMDQLNMVLSYIDTHFIEDLTLEQVADVAGFSKFHFSRLFKQYSGQNFYEYLCFRRIKSAETLLMTPSIPITDVALRSGFTSLSTFNRTFKKIKKCTPSHYRQMYISPLSPFVVNNDSTQKIEHKKDQTDYREGK